MASPSQIRLEAGLTKGEIAVESKISGPTVRVYEIDRMAVTPQKRRVLDAYYAALAKRVAAATPESPQAA